MEGRVFPRERFSEGPRHHMPDKEKLAATQSSMEWRGNATLLFVGGLEGTVILVAVER